VGGANGVDPPSLTRVWSANGELQGMYVVSFDWGRQRQGPEGSIFLIIITVPSG